MARHTVERLTSTEATARRYSHLCCRVIKGCSLRSASSSLLARWSSLGFEPGLFLGASGRPSSSLLVHLGVAFDGGEANGERAGGLALAHPAPERFDDLLPEVF